MYGRPSFLTTLGLRQESGTALAGPAVTQGSSEARAFQRCQVWRLKGKERWLSYRAITSSHCWASCSVCAWLDQTQGCRQKTHVPALRMLPTQGKTLWGHQRKKGRGPGESNMKTNITICKIDSQWECMTQGTDSNLDSVTI